MKNKKIRNGNLSYRHGKIYRKRRGYALRFHPGAFLFLMAMVFLLGGTASYFFLQRQTGRMEYGVSGIAAQAGFASEASIEGIPDMVQNTYGGSGAGLGGAGGFTLSDEKISDIQSSEAWKNIFENEYKYPPDLIKALKRNPEILDFASGYLTTPARATGGITKEEALEECPLFLQWDERWGYASYGSSNIGISGCGPTCLSMVLYSLTRDKSLTPDELAKEAMDGGYYVSGVGTAWSFMKEMASNYNVFVIEGDVWEEDIMKTYLNDGRLLICAMGPGDFTDNGHFIVIRGYSNGKFLVNDPFSITNSKRKWDYETIAGQCRQMWAFELIKK